MSNRHYPDGLYRPWSEQEQEKLQEIQAAASEAFGNFFFPLSPKKIGVVLLNKVEADQGYLQKSGRLRDLPEDEAYKRLGDMLPDSAKEPIELSIKSFVVTDTYFSKAGGILWIRPNDNDTLTKENETLRQGVENPYGYRKFLPRIVIGRFALDGSYYGRCTRELRPLHQQYRGTSITMGPVEAYK